MALPTSVVYVFMMTEKYQRIEPPLGLIELAEKD